MSQQQLYTNIFGAAATDQHEARLKEIIEKYPYYSTAHYFLLQHAAKDSMDYVRIAGRTAIHFNNPYYLNYLLHTDDEELISSLPEENVQMVAEVIEEKIDSLEEAPKVESKKRPQDDMIFEPLYTTDYFASQGIRLSDEVKPDDKLGKQLRSFTDWLKTMKKLHEQKLPPGNPGLDVTVQNIADKSNQEEEIITESMADVYKDQGKKAKAREIYQKLSLLDPSKSAYFAAKIVSLKDL